LLVRRNLNNIAHVTRVGRSQIKLNLD